MKRTLLPGDTLCLVFNHVGGWPTKRVKVEAAETHCLTVGGEVNSFNGLATVQREGDKLWYSFSVFPDGVDSDRSEVVALLYLVAPTVNMPHGEEVWSEPWDPDTTFTVAPDWCSRKALRSLEKA